MYLSVEQVMLFKQIEQKIITEVVYHYWVNKANPQEEFRFLEFIELKFDDSTNLFLKKEEDAECLQITAGFNIQKTNETLKAEFKGLIYYDSRKASNSLIWKPILNNRIAVIEMEKEEELFMGETILLVAADGYQVLLHTMPEGLDAEVYAPDRNA